MEQFKHRLKQACQASPNVPEYGKGEQVAIAKRLGVSQEAVRKWFNGDSEPRGERLRQLAEFLGADESWLSLGVKPTLNKSQKDSVQRLAKGAVHMLAGMIHFQGGHSAFPKDSDPAKSYVDIYCIMDGAHIAFHVSSAVELESGAVEFIVPLEYEQVHVVGAYLDKSGQVMWVDFPSKLIQDNKEPHAGDFKITTHHFGGKLVVAKGSLKTFTRLEEIL